ncbi:MAG: GspH/FimT family pseudopilin [Usitatibacter sp.]
MKMQRGMSIIEILVVFCIIGIVMAFVGPSAGVWIQNTQLRNAAESVLSGVQQARLEAIKRNKPVMFRLTDAATTAWDICLYDPVTDTCSAAANATIADKSASEGSQNARLATETTIPPSPTTALSAGAGMPATVTFDSFGRQATTASSNFTRVDVRNTVMPAADERRLVILVAAGGQIRMCDPKLSLATNPQGCV